MASLYIKQKAKVLSTFTITCFDQLCTNNYYNNMIRGNFSFNI